MLAVWFLRPVKTVIQQVVKRWHGTICRCAINAPVPEGADAIVMIEDSTTDDGNAIVNGPARPGYIRRRGENLREGDTALLSGMQLTPAALSLAATMGYGEVEVVVERGAGATAFVSDAAMEAAGARLGDRTEALGADVVATVKGLPPEDVAQVREGAVVLGLLRPLDAPEALAPLAERGATAVAMELVPRISRAQKMDALSAMSTVAGYRAVLLAAERLPKFFPLLTM